MSVVVVACGTAASDYNHGNSQSPKLFSDRFLILVYNIFVNCMPKKPDVETFLSQLETPRKPEILAVREIIRGVSAEIEEEIKWNAPSYSYHKQYLVTFALRSPEHVHLVFHNPLVPRVACDLFEGDYPDRRMVYFHSLEEISANRAKLAQALRDLLGLIDEAGSVP
jgi:uncharacterized protein YdhG (YjbR/CyaY superfamily)